MLELLLAHDFIGFMEIFYEYFSAVMQDVGKMKEAFSSV